MGSVSIGKLEGLFLGGRLFCRINLKTSLSASQPRLPGEDVRWSPGCARVARPRVAATSGASDPRQLLAGAPTGTRGGSGPGALFALGLVLPELAANPALARLPPACSSVLPTRLPGSFGLATPSWSLLPASPVTSPLRLPWDLAAAPPLLRSLPANLGDEWSEWSSDAPAFIARNHEEPGAAAVTCGLP